MRAHYIRAAARKSKRGEFLTCPDYFCDFWLESLGTAIYNAEFFGASAIVCWDFHGTTVRRRKTSLRYRITRRSDLEYGCGKLTTNFYDALKRLTTDSTSNDFSILWQIAFESRYVSFTIESETFTNERNPVEWTILILIFNFKRRMIILEWLKI